MGYRKGLCVSLKRNNSADSLCLDPDSSYEMEWPLWKKIVVWSSVSLLILMLLIFIIIWVIFPMVFWLSLAVKRFLMFIPINDPKHPDFEHPEAYGMNHSRNFYIVVTDQDNKTYTKIGAWLVLPEGQTLSNTSTIADVISSTQNDILVYTHGVAENRAKAIWKYGVFRKYFLVISIDPRGYGDSGQGVKMSEAAIINDNLQIFDWLRKLNSKSDVYYWGHSLGTALTCHTMKELKEKRHFVPKGVVLESPFTTMAEEIVNIVLGKIFKWLPYFHATILYPLDYSGFHFNSANNILSIDCPIMIMHAEDDNVVPSFLGKKLANIAKMERNNKTQGDVTFHLFPSELGYGHTEITHDENVPHYIEEFKEICQKFSPTS